VIECVKSFLALVDNQFNKKVKCVKSDNDTEFVNGKLQNIFDENDILHQRSCVFTPQQNFIVERKHRHILNVVRCIKHYGHIPLIFWEECTRVVVFLINRMPNKVLLNKTPFNIFFGGEFNYEQLKVFGCLAYATNLNTKHKFDDRASKCIFLCYPMVQKGYTLYNLKEKKIQVTRDVKFFEHEFPFKVSNINSKNEENEGKIKNLQIKMFVEEHKEPITVTLGDKTNVIQENGNGNMPVEESHDSIDLNGNLESEQNEFNEN
jgi:hypothetical protein